MTLRYLSFITAEINSPNILKDSKHCTPSQDCKLFSRPSFFRLKFPPKNFHQNFFAEKFPQQLSTKNFPPKVIFHLSADCLNIYVSHSLLGLVFICFAFLKLLVVNVYSVSAGKNRRKAVRKVAAV